LPQFAFTPRLIRLVNKDVSFAGPGGLAAWIRTTWLPYTQRVPVAGREEFIADVVRHYAARHPPDAEGNLKVCMVRLEIDAEKTPGKQFRPAVAGCKLSSVPRDSREQHVCNG
jgi:hypothetical protein